MLTRKRIWEIVEPAEENDLESRYFDIAMSTFIVTTVLAVILESMPDFGGRYPSFFDHFELFCILVFSLEYAVRLWSCKEDSRYSMPWGRLQWALSFMALIDLAAFFPGLLTFTSVDFRFLRAARLIRLFRLGRYSKSMKIIGCALKACRRQLMVTLGGVIILLLVAASALYYAERAAQPEAFGSIPKAMWWGVCTLTTVGYGDVYPITSLGKTLASIMAIMGIGTFALPAGILAAHFQQEIKNSEQPKKSKCPHCGKEID